MKKALEAHQSPLEKVMIWALLLSALTPALYADSTLTPAQNIKTLFFRTCIFVVSVLFAGMLVVKKDFRNTVIERIRLAWKSPIVKMMVVLYAILLVSTIFAHDRFYAFLGEPEREEGFLGLSFFYALFFYATILFKKKEWYRFFWLSLGTQIVVFFSALYQLGQGLHRTNSVLGNPIYFAVYGLTLLAIAGVVWVTAKKEKKPVSRFFGFALVLVGVLELFLGNTRSVLLGAAVGVPVVLAYAAINAEQVFPRINKKKVQKTAIGIFAGLAIFSGIFLSTRHAAIWSHVPGLDRVAVSSVGDSTTLARLVSWSIALHSIDPKEAGIIRTSFGWGWDNYYFAWQQFYQSRLYQYDTASFDHPHNKLLDMLVMNGAFGLAAYLALWFFFVRAVLHYGKREPGIALFLLFWSVAYFIQNLFAFDTIVSWILSFAIFGFVAYESLYEYQD